MTEDDPGRQPKRRRLRLVLAAGFVLLAVLIVPPLVSINRYKSQITHLLAASLGRPVRLSSVELRLLPWPGFVLNDLIVEEDPAFGAEPILHANTVTASIRLLSLWRGRLEIGRISVDEASMNLVRNEQGHWNLEPLFSTAAARAGTAASGEGRRRSMTLPYLEATNSRINIKNGVEKLPYSLISTDLSLWQDEPGVWRIRLRGQPARTDVSLDPADTGVMRLEASVHRAPELRQMPVHLDLDWREAQLGQLSRLLIGSDSGWRGNLTGELHLDGNADVAHVQTRLRATGVHRAEFEPAEAMDFDARCSFVYHHSSRALDDLSCDSPLGDGSIHLAGDMPAEGGHARFSVKLDQIPVAAGLEALRTVRSGFGEGLEARGTISGKIAYAQAALKERTRKNSTQEKTDGRTQEPFTGSFVMEGFQLSGDGLNTPIHIPRIVLEPVAALTGQHPALAASVAIPAGGTVPLMVNTRLELSGYRLTAHGQVTLARAREMAHAAGLANADVFDALAGEPISVDLSVEGPWIPSQNISFSAAAPASARNRTSVVRETPSPILITDEAARPVADSVIGTVTLHNDNWKADYLANPVVISTATLHLSNGQTRWNPVDFSYGRVKGTASLSVPASCDPPQPCMPRFQLQFGELNASVLQAAILGAHERNTLLSELIARLRFTSAPVWPRMEGTVKANTLILGPVTLRQPSAALLILPTGAEFTGLRAGVMGGSVQAAGTLSTGDKPFYSLTGRFKKLSPEAVGQLVGLRCSGGSFDADGQVDLSGYTDKDLIASAKGALHFEWRYGAVAKVSGSVPQALDRFERWTADAEIAKGSITLKHSQVVQGARKRAVEAVLIPGNPPRITFAEPRETRAKKR